MKLLLTAAIFCLGTLVPGAIGEEPSPEAAATIVLYNSNLPASRALAEYYASKRAIPETQLVGLPCAPDEEISREQYVLTIETPLRVAFTKFSWWQIEQASDGHRFVASANKRFVAVMRGVPMKIRPAAKTPPPQPLPDLPPGSSMEKLLPHNEAAVDSELATLFSLREMLPAFIPNPYYRRFTPILQMPAGENPLLVCRLDGPSDAVVRRMIDDSIAAERAGLWGWAYLDTRGISSPAYLAGEQWLAATAEMMRRQGIPVITDYAAETIPAGFPMKDAAIYYGWYANNVTGPFTQPDFHFRPGAIAVHLHSESGRTLRDPKAAWMAPLLARGAAATIGNVYEPYLELTVHFDILQDRLMNGLTLAESAYAAFRGLSWMGVVVGDPLYRPYASWFTLDSPAPSQSIWSGYRAAVLKAGSDPAAQAASLHRLAVRLDSSMPLEALGQTQAAAGHTDQALATLAAALAMETFAGTRFRITLEQIDILRHAGRKDAALAKIAAALEKFPAQRAQSTLSRLVLILDPPPAR